MMLFKTPPLKKRKGCSGVQYWCDKETVRSSNVQVCVEKVAKYFDIPRDAEYVEFCVYREPGADRVMVVLTQEKDLVVVWGDGYRQHNVLALTCVTYGWISDQLAAVPVGLTHYNSMCGTGDILTNSVLFVKCLWWNGQFDEHEE